MLKSEPSVVCRWMWDLNIWLEQLPHWLQQDHKCWDVCSPAVFSPPVSRLHRHKYLFITVRRKTHLLSQHVGSRPQTFAFSSDFYVLLKIKFLYWHLWFREEFLTSSPQKVLQIIKMFRMLRQKWKVLCLWNFPTFIIIIIYLFCTNL